MLEEGFGPGICYKSKHNFQLPLAKILGMINHQENTSHGQSFWDLTQVALNTPISNPNISCSFLLFQQDLAPSCDVAGLLWGINNYLIPAPFYLCLFSMDLPWANLTSAVYIFGDTVASWASFLSCACLMIVTKNRINIAWNQGEAGAEGYQEGQRANTGCWTKHCSCTSG